MLEPKDELRPIFNSYLNNELPDNLDPTIELFHPPCNEFDYCGGIPDPEDYINKQLDNLKYRQASYGFSSALAMLNIYCPISKKGVELIRDIAGGRQIVDPIAGRGFIAKGLRDLDCDVLAGDLHPDNAVTEVQCIDGQELIKQADDNALLILAWPPYMSNIDWKLAQSWGSRQILYIGDHGEATGSRKFANHFDSDLLDSPDDIYSHINAHWYLGQMDIKK
ncbi:hypothetical protein [Vibrio barjaei]|uniref:hypothetical protein n=1 Tax=Vibrio barjaei TaxID=1676683 RepID=UPI002284DDC3|nr:hypothetical protein [Vibrio barjaei]MCY9874036.1 hypothetical protein [Vibrio barjaei]